MAVAGLVVNVRVGSDGSGQCQNSKSDLSGYSVDIIIIFVNIIVYLSILVCYLHSDVVDLIFVRLNTFIQISFGFYSSLTIYPLNLKSRDC